MTETLRALAGLVVTPFAWLPATLGLGAFAVASGAGMLWVLGKTTDQRRLERARDRMVSAVYEVRLFLDTPGRVLRAQLRLLGASAVYVGFMLPALLVLAPPLLLLVPQLELRFGLGPLRAGEDALVRLDLAEGTEGPSVTVVETPGVRPTAPLLHVEDERALYLRVRIDEPGTRSLRVRVGGHDVEKLLVAGPTTRSVSAERSSGLRDALALGTEPSLAAQDGLTRIRVQHPAPPGRFLGARMPWWLYWLAITMLTALALRRRMGVVF